MLAILGDSIGSSIPSPRSLILTQALEFWSNRLAATDPPLEAAQTQIPHIPDQTEFLERWFEFHQGYRIVEQPDGSETRIAVIGEPFSEVSPGFLPRTLDQLRAGRENDASRPENIFGRRRLTSEEDRPQEPLQTIEDALDDLLAEVSEDEAEPGTPVTAPQNADMVRRPSSGGLSRPLTRTEISLHRARDRLVRVFGSREDVQRDDYESPLSTMYNRAERLYNQAEERRSTGATSDPRLSNLSNISPSERRELEEQILWGVLQDSHQQYLNLQEGNVRSYTPAPGDRRRDNAAAFLARAATDESFHSPSNSLRTSLEQINSDLTRLQVANDAITRLSRLNHHTESIPTPTLDEPDRPPPLTEAQMTRKLDCQVCYAQIADIAVLPCGHMVMCQWCADITIPIHHGNVPLRPSKCPMCRKGVRQRVRIRIAGGGRQE